MFRNVVGAAVAIFSDVKQAIVAAFLTIRSEVVSQLARESVLVDSMFPVVKSAHTQVELCVSTTCITCHVSVHFSCKLL